MPVLQARVADYPQVLAEGGANFWDAFQLIPLSRGFWHEGFWFEVFPTRHHAPMTSFGLSLARQLGLDRRHAPDPGDALALRRQRARLVAHDCALDGNPSHSGLDDLEREYPSELRERLILYHYGSTAEAAKRLRERGYRVADRGEASGAATGPMPRWCWTAARCDCMSEPIPLDVRKPRRRWIGARVRCPTCASR